MFLTCLTTKNTQFIPRAPEKVPLACRHHQQRTVKNHRHCLAYPLILPFRKISSRRYGSPGQTIQDTRAGSPNRQQSDWKISLPCLPCQRKRPDSISSSRGSSALAVWLSARILALLVATRGMIRYAVKSVIAASWPFRRGSGQ